ncbi:MAG: sulfatase-like hydrolase/transferase, partial [Candidatus Omnitrophica bacterium]|nr:sulfatase-like hydrolase/transferase [Candidatus Omnitrophota bacterium]
MRHLVFLILLTLALPVWSDDRPNIIFVMTDDQAPWDLGCSGNPEAHTPNMDRFFSQGVMLKNCFAVTPVCSPSRAALMTSRYGTELGVTDWINPREEPDLGLDPKYVTWPEVLHDAGYQTAMIGKWHLGTAPEFHPYKNGFDVFRGFLEGGNKVENAVFEVDGATVEARGLTVDFLTDQAIRFLNEDHGDKPFLMCMHYRSPHAPWLPVWESDWEPYADLDPTIPNPDYPDLDVELVKKKMREYLASTTGVDTNFGRILRQLDNLGLSDNTIVVFTSDHGYNMGHNGIWHKGNGHWITKAMRNASKEERQRPNMYDNSIRVPAAIRWPGKLEAGKHLTETITHIDWYPTLLALAGVDLPKDVLL